MYQLYRMLRTLTFSSTIFHCDYHAFYFRPQAFLSKVRLWAVGWSVACGPYRWDFCIHWIMPRSWVGL